MLIKVQDFFRPIHFADQPVKEDYEKLEPYLRIAKSWSELTYQSIYLVDYYRRCFLYVSNNPLFLCGKSAEQLMKDGFLFYLKNVQEDDLQLLLRINEAGFSFIKNVPEADRLKYYISYDFHLKQPNGNLTLINHKLMPLVLDKHSNPWIASCLVSLSPSTKSGNVRFCSKELNKFFEFDLETNQWTKFKRITLNEREKSILMYSVQGLTMDKIASKIFVSVDTVKFHKKNLFHKLNVKTITEATAKAIDLALL